MKISKIYYGWWIVVCGGIITGFSTTMVNTLNSLYVIPITLEFGFTRSQYIMTSTLTAVAAIFGAAIIGRMMTNKNMKKIQVFLLVTMTMAYMSFSISTKLWQFYIASIVIGFIFMSIAMIPVSVMIANWFDSKQGLAMSLVLAGIGIGGTILSPITSSLILEFGWRIARIYIAIAYLLISLPIIVFVLKSSPEEVGLQPYKEESKDKGSLKRNAFKEYPTVEAAKKTHYYVLFIFGVIASGVICNGGMQHMGPFVTDNHSSIIASYIISVYSFSAVFGKLLLGYLYDKFGNTKSLLFGGGMFAGAYVLMAFFPKNLILIVLAAIMFGVGNSLGSVSINLVTFSIFGKKNYSTMLSLAKSLQQIGMASGPIIVSLLFEKFNGYTVPFAASIIISILLMFSWIKSYNDAKKTIGA